MEALAASVAKLKRANDTMKLALRESKAAEKAAQLDVNVKEGKLLKAEAAITLPREAVELIGKTIFNAQLPTYWRKGKELPLFPGEARTKFMSSELEVLCNIRLLIMLREAVRDAVRAKQDAVLDRTDGMQMDGATSHGTSFEGFTFLVGKKRRACTAALMSMVSETAAAKGDAYAATIKQLQALAAMLEHAQVRDPRDRRGGSRRSPRRRGHAPRGVGGSASQRQLRAQRFGLLLSIDALPRGLGQRGQRRVTGRRRLGAAVEAEALDETLLGGQLRHGVLCSRRRVPLPASSSCELFVVLEVSSAHQQAGLAVRPRAPCVPEAPRRHQLRRRG